jgi:bifunctional N-acetylglucosamine-1-phosphate-uridyltransferase/glucosamine-1-phosphate-acetyltransferase GlmU-like protein
MDAQVCGAVFAAGRSTRMQFNKLTAPIAGKPMVWYAVDNLRKARIGRIIVVIGFARTEVKQCIGEGVEWVVQEDQKGTGDAAAHALTAVEDEQHIVILFGDCPFLDAPAISRALEVHFSENADVTLATARLKEAGSLGRIVRDADNRIHEIKERFEDAESRNRPSEIFAGLSVWRVATLKAALEQIPFKTKPDQREEKDLPDAVRSIAEQGGRVCSYSDIADKDALGPNEFFEFVEASSYLKLKVCKFHIENHAVRIANPQTVSIDYAVQIGTGTWIGEHTYLAGNTRIGRNCRIGPNSTLTDCAVADDCEIGKGSWENQVFPAGSKASDRLATEHKYFRKPHFLIPEDPNFCFVFMPFRDEYFALYDNVIRPCLESHGFSCRNSAEHRASGIVTEDIWSDINRARFVIAEITEDNRNVWYELGLAHALNKDVIMPVRREKELPFDVRVHRVLTYSPNRFDLKKELDRWLHEIRQAQQEHAADRKPPGTGQT